jgi:mercuric ion binding protein
MKKIVIALAMGITAISSMAATSMKFTVNGMVCSFCAQGIEKSLAKMGATKEVFVDLNCCSRSKGWPSARRQSHLCRDR